MGDQKTKKQKTVIAKMSSSKPHKQKQQQDMMVYAEEGHVHEMRK